MNTELIYAGATCEFLLYAYHQNGNAYPENFMHCAHTLFARFYETLSLMGVTCVDLYFASLLMLYLCCRFHRYSNFARVGSSVFASLIPVFIVIIVQH